MEEIKNRKTLLVILPPAFPMHNFMLSICSTHCRDFINGKRLFLQESAGFWKLRAVKTMDGVWAAQHSVAWGRVFHLPFAFSRLTCVKGKAKKAFLFPVRNISVFCLREQLPRQWFIYWSHSPLIHLLSKPQAQEELLAVTEQGCPCVANTVF